MRRNRFMLAALLATLVLPALAQQPNPCVHAGDQMVMGGMDVVMLRCQLAVDDQRIADLDKQLRATETDRLIARNDAWLAKTDRDKREKDLAEWFKGWFGDAKPDDPK